MTDTKTIAQDVTARLRYASVVKNDLEGVDDWLYVFQNDAKVWFYANPDRYESDTAISIFEDGSMGLVTFDRQTTARVVTGSERKSILESVQSDGFLENLNDEDLEFFLYLD